MDAANRAINQWLASGGWTTEAFVRLCLAAILGGVIGLERELRGRPAGFRTNLLVCMGSALVMLVSMKLVEMHFVSGGANINVDPGRIAYGVMMGIGFLGAGAILKHEESVHGLTTGAGLWCVAALGLAVGMGLYILALLSAALVLVALGMLNYAEAHFPRRRFKKIKVRCPWEPDCIHSLVARVQHFGVGIVARNYRRVGDLSEVEIELSVWYTDQAKFESLEHELHRDALCKFLSSETV
jgi:putative Mg2+ transporter-C (MgtC) family protein